MKKEFKIEINNACVKIPIYDANHSSLRNRILSKKMPLKKIGLLYQL